MDESQFKENACNRCQAREKACERGTIGFDFASHRPFSPGGHVESQRLRGRLGVQNQSFLFS